MRATLFNAIYKPLPVKFGCHTVAAIPAAIAATMMKNAQQNPDDGLTGGYAVTARVALEYCLKRRFFV